MSDAGQGGAYYIEKTDQASDIFEEELEGLLSLAAQNIRVTVTPGADAEFVRVLHNYPNHAEDDVLTVEVGDLYAREPRRVLMEFLVGPEATGADVAEVAELTVTAHVLTDEGGVELHTIALPITVSPEEGGKVDPVVRKEILLIEAAEAREKALEAQRRGDYRGGSAMLRESMRSLREMAEHDPQVAEELRDLASTAELYDSEQLSVSDIKYMKQRSYSTHRSRDSERERYRRTKEEGE
jgi:Ca-activated chloride channel family protein